jgi:molecular chaperone DnaK (HSP70)
LFLIQEFIDLRNEAENTYFNTEKQLNEFRSKLSQQEIEEIEGAVVTLKKTNSSLTTMHRSYAKPSTKPRTQL